MKMKKTSIKFTKSRLIIGAVVALSAIASGYAYWSVQTWNNYETSYATWKQDITHDIDTALQSSAITSDERSKKIADLKSVAASIKENQSVCSISGVVQWQRNIGGLGSRIETCNEMMRPMTEYSDKLDRALAYLESERKVADIINSSVTNKKQTEKTWDAQLAGWSKAAGDISSMQVADDFMATKDYALKYAKKMEAAWKNVVAAHRAKSKAKYLKAYAEVVSAHDMLATLASDSQARFKSIATDLQASYDALK